MKNVLIINQSAELYGADKALLELIENYPKGYNPIVVLHEKGPLTEVLEKKGVQVILSSVIKVKRGILKPGFFIKLPFETILSIYRINKELKGKKIAFIHSNAISVFIGAFYSFLLRKKHIWHVHEIIIHPKTLAKWYPKIVSFFSDKIIFNSNATFEQFKKHTKNIDNKSIVIHNGQNRLLALSTEDQKLKIRLGDFKINDNTTIVIGLVGRISRLKGQQVLLKSFLELSKKYSNIHLVYIGSTPNGQEHYLEKLEAKIKEYELGKSVTILDFKKDIWNYYDALDIVVVPSKEPESFGLVATEAMLSKKPVIGSNLGGLREVIVHEETGFLFEANDSVELAMYLEKLILNKDLIKSLGENGYERVIKCFSAERYVAEIKKQYDNILGT
jgi:glycosyltransferase involved in cell wall biosynthesis